MTTYLQRSDRVAELDAIVERSPIGPPSFEPGLLDGMMGAPARGLLAGGANLALMAAEAGTPLLAPVAKSIDEAFDTSLDDWLDGQMEATRQAVRDIAPNVNRTGTAGRIVHSLFQVGSEAILGALVAGLPGAMVAAGGGEGFGSYLRSTDQGVDSGTALKLAAAEGLAVAAGVALPVAGSTLRSSIAIGTGGNVGLGAVQRGVSHQILESNGYPIMAQQYRWNDAEAIAADAVLGSVFGVLGFKLSGRSQVPELRDSVEVDAALAISSARHADATAPGLPTDINALATHHESFNAALDAMLHDRPVDVAESMPTTSDATYLRDPAADAIAKARQEAAAEYLALEQEAALTRTPRDVVVPEIDSLATAIAKLGGLDRAQVASEWGTVITGDAKALNRLGPFGKPVLRNEGGKLIDEMVEALGERGYLPVDAHGKADSAALFDALRAEAVGDRQYTPAGIEAQARRMAAEDELARRQEIDREASDERAAIQAESLPPELAELPVTNERGETVTAREAYAEVQTQRLELDRERRMVTAAATCEAALT